MFKYRFELFLHWRHFDIFELQLVQVNISR